MCFEQFKCCNVVGVVGIDVGVERSGVDDDCPYRSTSVARISSMRSETSLRPLRPAPAAPRRRLFDGLLPRYASRASRLMSAMVVPRRAASCRSRASSASGILTVVRFMYASIPGCASACKAAESGERSRPQSGKCGCSICPLAARQNL